MTVPPVRPAPVRAQVDRTSRLVDLAALVLLAGGAGTHLYAERGMRRLAGGRMRFESLTGSEGGWNLTTWGDYLRLSRIGLGLAIAGVAIGIIAFARHAAVGRRKPADEQAHHP